MAQITDKQRLANYKKLVLHMGRIIRLLDEDCDYQELWTLDGKYMNYDIETGETDIGYPMYNTTKKGEG